MSPSSWNLQHAALRSCPLTGIDPAETDRFFEAEVYFLSKGE